MCVAEKDRGSGEFEPAVVTVEGARTITVERIEIIDNATPNPFVDVTHDEQYHQPAQLVFEDYSTDDDAANASEEQPPLDSQRDARAVEVAGKDSDAPSADDAAAVASDSRNVVLLTAVVGSASSFTDIAADIASAAADIATAGDVATAADVATAGDVATAATATAAATAAADTSVVIMDITAETDDTIIGNLSDNSAAVNPTVVVEVPSSEARGALQQRMMNAEAAVERSNTVVVVVPNDQLSPANEPLIPGRRRDPNRESTAHSLNCFRCNNANYMGSTVLVTLVDFTVGVGLKMGLSAAFILGELSGVGLLLAPHAIQTLGWPGFIYMFILAIVTVYCSECLGGCWQTTEEQMNLLITSECRTPMSLIAYHAFGIVPGHVTTACVAICLYSVSCVYLMLLGQTFGYLLTTTQLFETVEEEYKWIFIGVLLVLANNFLETPKKFTLAASSMMIITMAASFCILTQMVKEGYPDNDDDVNFTMKFLLSDHEDLTIIQKLESFGTLIFVFGVATMMPVIQHSRYKESEFSISLLMTFSLLAVLFTTVVTVGYLFFDGRLTPNILMTLASSSWFTTIALILFSYHLFIGTQIILSPVCFVVESVTKAETKPQKSMIHILLLLPMVLLSYYVQNVSFFTAVVGGSIVSIVIYVIPSLFYIFLTREVLNDWHDRSLPLIHKIFSFAIVICGTLMSLLIVCIAIASCFNINLLPAQTYLDSYFTAY